MTILLADDNENDVTLIEEAIRQANLDIQLSRVSNGAQCLRFLRGEGEHAGEPLPDLLILDINMPVMNGFEVMEELVADASLRHLPVLVLTTSSEPVDVVRMHQLRCNSFFTKPHQFDEFVRIMKMVTSYWGSGVQLPAIPDLQEA